jgi:hypothetical protein
MSIKKSFKIFLDSNNTASWYGTLYKANYYVDLNQIIKDANDFRKSYNMYCTFMSESADNTANNINSTNVYTIHIDMGKGLNVYQYRSIKTPSFLVPVQTILNEAAANQPYTYFNLQDTFQRPTYIDNILNLNVITLNVIDTSTNATFVPGATVCTYVCVLTFVEC